MELLLLLAGCGKRLGNITKTRNKCMIKINGVPILEHSLKIAEKLPISKWNIVIGYQSEQVVSYIENRINPVSVRFVHQVEQKGIVHAMQISSNLLDDDILLNLGDEFLINSHVDKMINFFHDNNVDFICGIIEGSSFEKISKAFSIKCNPKSGYIVEVKEKPITPYNNILGTGYCIFGKETLPYLERVPINSARNQYELCDFIKLLIEKGKNGVCFPVGDDLINVNTYEDLYYLKMLEGQ